MSRRVSLPGRRHFDGLDRTSVPLVLMEITHPDMAAPLRLSTDTTERLSDDPLRYGTRSTWRGADPTSEPFLFIAADVEWPGEIEDVVPEARLVLSLVTSAILSVLRSVTTPATCNLALVMSGTPDLPEEEHIGMELTLADADLSAGGSVELTLAHRAVDMETFPAVRMTARRFPGLIR